MRAKFIFSLIVALFSGLVMSAQESGKSAITVNSMYGKVEMSKAALKSASFDYHSEEKLPTTFVNGFKIKVPGHRGVEIDGTKLSEEAINAISTLNVGDQVVVYDGTLVDKKQAGITKVQEPTVITIIN